MSRLDPARTAVELLRPRLPRLLLAVLFGVVSLGSALALAGTAAWLITRAWQMPPVLDLSVAVVTVRALGISRGIFGYCERLASHDTALRAANSARQRLYLRLARGPIDAAMRHHSGELVTRVGADVDTLADVIVRAVLPISVAAVLSVAAVAVVVVLSPAAAVVLAICLVVAGVIAPWLAARAVTTSESVAAQHHTGRDVAALLALEHAPELRVCGRLTEVIAESKTRQHRLDHSIDRAAAPAAVATATAVAAVGLSVLGAAIAAILLGSAAAPTSVAILMLLPLSAFEATAALPRAAVQLTTSRLAVQRLGDLTGPEQLRPTTRPLPRRPSRLAAADLFSGHPGKPATGPLDLALNPGDRLVVTGPSGSGKTALLMTVAGLLAPAGGEVLLGDRPLATVDEADLRAAVVFFAEDAHLFATTVRDNLLVARGSATDDELDTAVRKVGLGAWLDGLPERLSTLLVGGAEAISAGQRRRLLLARALLSPVPIILLDEPTENLDAAAGRRLLSEILTDGALFESGRTVVVASHHLPGVGCRTLNITAAGNLTNRDRMG